MAKLHILSGEEKGQVFELTGDMVTIGRAPNNMIRLSEDSVSIYHATFVRDGASYRLRDLNSSNHTRVNGTRILASNLNDGDYIEFGDLEARFETDIKDITVPPPTETSTDSPQAVEELTAAPNRQRAVKANTWQRVRIVVILIAALILGFLGFVAGRFWDGRKTTTPTTAEEMTKPSAPQAVATEMPVIPPPKTAATTVSNEVPTVVKNDADSMMSPVDRPEDKQTTSPEMPVTPDKNATTNTAPVLPDNPPQPVPNVSPETNAPPAPIVTEPGPTTVTPPPAIPAPQPTNAATRVTERTEKIPAPIINTPPKVKPNPYEGAGVLAAQTQVDQLVAGRLQRMGIASANLCSDGVFVRRVYLDVIGTVPTAEEVRAFLEDRNPNKRNALIDRLLERDEFADYWAMKWCDLLRVKAEFPINLWPNAVQTYHQWIRTCLKENRPYDRFVRDLLTSSGSNFREPPVNFYRAVQSKDPESLTKTVALTFMGSRAENWPKEKLAGMTTFFSQVGFKATSEWKEEIVFYDPGKATNATNTAVFPDGTSVELPVGKDPRAVFANWLITPQNPWFTRNIVNRVWSWLLGRGIIHEPDDIRPDNPPVNPELLTLLERELVANKYDLKAVYRMILKSRTYQLSAVPRSNDPRAEANFAFYPVRRLEAEVLIDAVNQITGTTEKYSSPIPEPFTFIPENVRSIALADGSISSPFLDLFGRSSRATGMEAERNNRPTAAQQLHLLNSSHIQRKIEQSAKLKALLQQAKGRPRGVVDALYLAILSRYPDDEEVRVINAYSRTEDLSQRAGLDLAWALINSAEFQNRH